MSDKFTQTDRNRVLRMRDQAHYDRETIYEILDCAFLCHIAFVHKEQPIVLPTCYGRDGDTVFIHGAAASRMMNKLGEGLTMSLAVTLLDGLVLARSSFNHSINYRSVVLFGTAMPIVEKVEKVRALKAISDQIILKRFEDTRKPTGGELAATSVLAIKIDEATAKIRKGPPDDDEGDLTLPYWAGVVPFTMVAHPVINDPRLEANKQPPEYINQYIEDFEIKVTPSAKSRKKK
ncbi:pyridoxamine 5'-phosphate oxidase family protein [soil metagenome]